MRDWADAILRALRGVPDETDIPLTGTAGVGRAPTKDEAVTARGVAHDLLVPQSLPDVALMAAPFARVPMKAALAGYGALTAMSPSEAQAGPLQKLVKALQGSIQGELFPNQKLGPEILRGYHGSTERNLKNIRSRNAVETRGATFHASNPDVAETFTFPREYGESVFYDELGKELKRGRVYETQLSPRKIYEVAPEDAQKFIDDSAFQQNVVNEARAHGFDAIRAKNVLEGIGERYETDVYGALNDDIVKILRKYGLLPAAATGAGMMGASDSAEAAPTISGLFQ